MEKKAVRQTTKPKVTARKPIRSGNVLHRTRFKRVSKKQIRWVVDRLVEQLNPERIILFGSYAYGKPNVDSDVDMLVIMESDLRWTTRTTQAYAAVRGKTFPMDLVVRTPAEMAE